MFLFTFVLFTISPYQSRKCLGAERPTRHYLSESIMAWLTGAYMRHYISPLHVKTQNTDLIIISLTISISYISWFRILVPKALSYLSHMPSNPYYKSHIIRQWNCWSLTCSWGIACQRCSNYIFILDLTPGSNGLGKDKCKTRRETFTFWELVRHVYWRFAGIHSTSSCGV